MQSNRQYLDQLRASLQPAIDEHSKRICSPRFLPISPYVASSLMQKAIRRGDVDLAQCAALILYRQRPSTVWKRLLLIAFEDVGIGSVDAVVKASSACLPPRWNGCGVSDEVIVAFVSRLLANAPKDRSSDYLICSAKAHPILEEARLMVGSMPTSRQLGLMVDDTLPLPVRAVAAWHASGVDCGRNPRVGKGVLNGFVDVLVSRGVPKALALAAQYAATQTREPICVLVPLIWLVASTGEQTSAIACSVPPSPVIDGVPLYALDKHTATGKAAIHRFARENEAVRETLSLHAPEYKAQTAACMAAFYADAVPVSCRLEWSQSRDLEALGTENDMMVAGVEQEGVQAVVAAVRDNLDHLNAIRGQLFRPHRAGGWR